MNLTAIAPSNRREGYLLIGGLLIGAVLASVIWIATRLSSDSIDREFEPVSGEVVLINPGAEALCMELESDDGKKWCSGVYGDMSGVKVGDSVSGYRVLMPTADGSSATEGFLYPSFD